MTTPSGVSRFSGGQIRRGSLWSLGGAVIGHAIRFASNLAMVHLLAGNQGAFKQQLLITSFLQLLELLTDVGIWLSIIRSPRGLEPTFTNTVWTLQVIRGLLLAATACCVAPYYAEFYDDTALTPLIYASASTLAIGGFGSTKLYVMRRQLAIRPLVAIELCSQAFGALVGILVALRWPTVMALVLNGIAASTLRVVASHLLPGPRDRFAIDRSVIREVVNVGAWAFVNTTLSFLAMQDRLLLARFGTDAELDTYYVTYMIATMPTALVGGLLWSLLLPIMSAHVRSGGDFAANVLRSRSPSLLVSGWCLSGICAGGPTIVDFLYPSRFAEGGWMLQWITVTMWLGTILEQSRATILASMNKLSWTSAGSVAKLIAAALLVPIGFAEWGFHGAIVFYALAELPRLLLTWWLCRASGVSGMSQDLGTSSLFLVAAVAGDAVQDVLAHAGAPETVVMLAVFGIVSLVWLPFSWKMVMEFFRRA